MNAPVTNFNEHMNTLSRWMIDSGLVDRWKEGSIYPREMVWFMSLCLAHDIDIIVESGRQYGYSTEILGQFAERFDKRVFSLDVERDEAMAEQVRDRLQSLKKLTLLKGNTYIWMGPLLYAHLDRKIALLIDGPKEWDAISLAFSSGGMPNVQFVAMHNIHGELERFLRRYEGSFNFYEDWQNEWNARSNPSGGSSRPALPAWEELSKREIDLYRPADRSSLYVVYTQDRKRKWFWPRRVFGLRQPIFTYIKWKILARG